MWIYKRTIKLCLILCLVFCLVSMFYVIRDGPIDKFIGRYVSSKVTKFSSGVANVSTSAADKIYRPKILVWAKPYVKYSWILADLPNGDGGCDFTLDRKEYTNSDALIFFMKSCVSTDLPDPKKRSPNQAFVWWSHESPHVVQNYFRHKLNDFKNYFNWTMTFRRDSDVLATFAPVSSMDYILYKFDRKKEMKDRALVDKLAITNEKFREQLNMLMKKKTKFISWVVSDCNTLSGATRRMKLVDGLTEEGLLAVDRFGKCVNREIPADLNRLFETISEYKFYFAFENSYHCRDYLTEKSLYNSLVSGTVPVIYGPTKEDTEKILPKGSFIHYEDFENKEKFAQYLKYLDSNDTAYMKYFDWWKQSGTHVIPRYGFNFGSQYAKTDVSNYFQNWDIETPMKSNLYEIKRFGLYHLCRKLRNRDHVTTSRTYEDISSWWYKNESEVCLK